MISDVLSDASADLAGYLEDPAFLAAYSDEVRLRVRQLQRDMLGLVAQLDAVPAGEPVKPTATISDVSHDPIVMHLVRWLAPFVERNAEDFTRTWSFVVSDAVAKLKGQQRDDALLAAYDTVCAIRREAGILDS